MRTLGSSGDPLRRKLDVERVHRGVEYYHMAGCGSVLNGRIGK
jgi:hypothetical protein